MVVGEEPISFKSNAGRLVDFFLTPLNLVDLFAILPFYLELLLHGLVQIEGSTVVRVVRLTRLLRLLKTAKYSDMLTLLVRVMRSSMSALQVLVFYLVLFLIFSAAFMFFFEGGDYDLTTNLYWRTDQFGERSVTPFRSIPSSLWWSLITYTTIGYGEMFPLTPAGKMVAGFIIVAGLVLFAMPLAVLAANFSKVWEDHIKEKLFQQKMEIAAKDAVEAFGVQGNG